MTSFLTAGSGITSISTSFVQDEYKYLLATWSSVSRADANLNFRVGVAEIPVPATGLLLVSGLLVMLSRRRKAA